MELFEEYNQVSSFSNLLYANIFVILIRLFRPIIQRTVSLITSKVRQEFLPLFQKSLHLTNRLYGAMQRQIIIVLKFSLT